jgi:hypothetical protein
MQRKTKSKKKFDRLIQLVDNMNTNRVAQETSIACRKKQRGVYFEIVQEMVPRQNKELTRQSVVQLVTIHSFLHRSSNKLSIC